MSEIINCIGDIMGFLKTTLYVILVVLLIIIVSLLIALLTGRDKRAYPILPFDQPIKIGQDQRTIIEWAEIYQPLMKIRSTTPSPDLLFAYVEAIDHGETIDFVYYHVWEDEIHPNKLLHFLYRVFRGSYYGMPVRDIEYCQVNVNRQTGDVDRLRFETTPGTDYDVVISEHIISIYKRNNHTFDLERFNTKGNLLSKETGVNIQFDLYRPVLGVATWNHLSQIVSPGDQEFSIVFNAPLKPLTNQEYQNGKFVRKSQADYKTIENPITKYAGTVAFFIFIGIPANLLYRHFFMKKVKR